MMTLVRRVAPSEFPVLIQGESGTGKELVAECIHKRSARAGGPFVPVDCTGLAEALFESELFGHEKGAFTGAVAMKRGLVEVSNGGTLFLDEIGDLPAAQQSKLLRLLETRRFRRVGGTREHQSDFRLICATNASLEQRVRDGRFRVDLFYRINVVPIHVPPVRERMSDLPLLLDALAKELGCEESCRPEQELLAEVVRGGLPGNVRELRNLIMRRCVLGEAPELMDVVPNGDTAARDDHAAAAQTARTEIRPLWEVEQDYLRWAAAVHHGDRGELAAKLGLSERTLYRKLRSVLDRNGAGTRRGATLATCPPDERLAHRR
jgi:DNA-binding NtrC family response regulator